tara:strand:- start:359 stop:694 length:336 start_codon:yes stop_codon:yes gene_type:complete
MNNKKDIEERRECEKVVERIITGVIKRLVPQMNIVVKIKMLGREDYIINMSRQTTLHEFTDLGINPNEDNIYNYMDISINKIALRKPELSHIVNKLLDDIEIRLEEIRKNE